MTNRKEIKKIQTQKIIHHEIKKQSFAKIISIDNYKTGSESLLVIKDTENCLVTLDSNVNDKITIKSLTNVTVKPDMNLIDEEWEEIMVEKGSCVQFYFVGDVWYIVSSDGTKII